jgi:hypothetical protein
MQQKMCFGLLTLHLPSLASVSLFFRRREEGHRGSSRLQGILRIAGVRSGRAVAETENRPVRAPGLQRNCMICCCRPRPPTRRLDFSNSPGTFDNHFIIEKKAGVCRRGWSRGAHEGRKMGSILQSTYRLGTGHGSLFGAPLLWDDPEGVGRTGRADALLFTHQGHPTVPCAIKGRSPISRAARTSEFAIVQLSRSDPDNSHRSFLCYTLVPLPAANAWFRSSKTFRGPIRNQMFLNCVPRTCAFWFSC